MPMCYHCGQEAQTFYCDQCGQSYCALHKEPINHDCNIVKETANLQLQPVSPSYVPVARSSPTIQDNINQQQRPPSSFQVPAQSSSHSGGIRGTTDGSYTWYRQEQAVPENAFDPDSGIEFKGIFLAHKSEGLHFLIGGLLIYLIGLLSFYDPLSQAQLEQMNMGWVLFMMAGFFTLAFIAHELGHRQVAKRYKLQTKFRLLTFGMFLTFIVIGMILMSMATNTQRLPIPALPGAVVVLGLDKIDKKTGWCKAAGPLVNLVMGTVLLIASFAISTDLFPLNIYIAQAAGLNFMLGAFNLIPIGILDGQNIIKWKPAFWFVLVAVFIIMLFITYANIYAEIPVNVYYPEEIKQAYIEYYQNTS